VHEENQNWKITPIKYIHAITVQETIMVRQSGLIHKVKARDCRRNEIEVFRHPKDTFYDKTKNNIQFSEPQLELAEPHKQRIIVREFVR
jgi:hypothetical protein